MMTLMCFVFHRDRDRERDRDRDGDGEGEWIRSPPEPGQEQGPPGTEPGGDIEVSCGIAGVKPG